MARQYRSREGPVAALDTKTQLVTLGSEAAPGPLLVPQGASKLVGILAAGMADGAVAATDYGIIVRLEGAGLLEGQEVIGIGAGGSTLATGRQGNIIATNIVLNVPVISANEILIFAEMTGEDAGTLAVGVTLIFE